MKRRYGTALVLLALLMLVGSPASARVTMSGTLEAYKPGERKLLLRLDSGKKKQVVLLPNARFEKWGRRATPSAFTPGMRVAIRVAGALNDDPLKADMLMDVGSSSRHVATTAGSPYYTPIGSHATTGGVGGMIQGGLQFQAPSVIGPVGLGGNIQSMSTLHPAQQPWPAPQSATPGMPAQPAPAGSPFLGDALGGGPAATGLITGGSGPSGGAGAAGLMGTGGDSSSGESSSPAFGFGPAGPQVVQMQARVVSVDPARRMMAVQAQGSPTPQWVVVPPAVFVTSAGTGQGMAIDSLQPGQTVQVTGMANAAGFVEARQVVAP